MAMMVFLDEGSGIYHSKEVDTNRTTTIDVGKGGGYIGDKFFHTSTPSLRYNTGKNVNVDPDNINTDIHAYIQIYIIHSLTGIKTRTTKKRKVVMNDDEL